MSEKYKKIYKYLNHVEHLRILVSKVTDCVSIFVFASLVCVPVDITSSAVGIKICAITAETLFVARKNKLLLKIKNLVIF